MNKQEAIEKIKNIEGLTILDSEMIPKKEVLNIVNQIDEPQKPVIQKFVADWIEYCKSNKLTLLGAFDPVSEHGIGLANTFTMEVWKCIDWAKRNQDAFARAWLSGYEVEKEKLYTVEIPNPNSNAHTVLKKTEKGIVSISVTGARWRGWKSSKLTESEIKEDFEWAWQWAKEVEE